MIYKTPKKGEKYIYQPSSKKTKPYEVSELVWFVRDTEEGQHIFKKADNSELILDTLADIFPFFIELPYQEPKMSKNKTFYR